MSWEILRYKCQLKGANSRWETIKVTHNEEEAELWMKSELKHGKYPCRTIREEYMIIDDD